MNHYENTDNIDESVTCFSKLLQKDEEADFDANLVIYCFTINLKRIVTAQVPAGKHSLLDDGGDDATNLVMRASHWELLTKVQAVVARE